MARNLTTAPLSFQDCYAQATDLYKRTMPVVLPAAFVMNLPGGVVSLLAKLAGHSVLLGLALLPLSLVLPFLMIFLTVGLQRLVLKLTDGGDGVWQDVLSGGPYFLSALGAAIVTGILTIIGLLLLVVPGVYVALRLSMAIFLIIDRNLGAIDALKQSWAMTQGRIGLIFAIALPAGIVVLLDLGLGLLGALGTILTVAVGTAFLPLIWLAMAQVYRRLSGAQQDAMIA